VEDVTNRRRAWNGAVYALVAGILITGCSLLAGALVRAVAGSGTWAAVTQITVLGGLSVAAGCSPALLRRRGPVRR
jgi:hypothetical protein